MLVRTLSLVTLVLVAIPAATAQDSCCGAEYRYGFSLERLLNTTPGEGVIDDGENCNAIGEAVVGSTCTVYANVISDARVSVTDWSLCIEVTGDLDLVDATIDGTSSAPLPDGRFLGGLSRTSVVDPEKNDGRRGAVSWVLKCGFLRRDDQVPLDRDPIPKGCRTDTLPLQSTESTLKLTFEGEIGDRGSVFFADGLIGEGQPVDNVLSARSAGVGVCNLRTTRLDLLVVATTFLRGDPNDDGRANIADAVWILNELFRANPRTACEAAADANADGHIDLADVAYLIVYRFAGGSPPPAPFPECSWLAPEEAAAELPCSTPPLHCR